MSGEFLRDGQFTGGAGLRQGNRPSGKDRVRPARLLAWLAAAALLAGCGSASDGAEADSTLLVSAAISLSGVLTELGEEYERANPGTRIRYNFASSGALQQQIEQGARVDVFVSAAARQMDELARRGLIEGATRTVLASNELVLAAPAGSGLAGISDLAGPGVERVAIGAPASVPAGEYARQWLATAAAWEEVEPRLVYAASARQVLTYLQRGEVDAGFVYASDAVGDGALRVVATAPPGAHDAIAYPAAVVADSRNAAEARRFLRFLRGAEAAEAFRRSGFQPGSPNPPLPS